MSEEIRDDMSFEEMLKATEANANVYTGKIVKAKVISVSPTECVVGIDGSKHTGIVKLSEMSHDPNAKMEDLVKVDDELDLVVVKTNDQEGVDTLSRVRFEAQKGMKDVSEAAENGTVMEGDVMEANKGGVVVNVKGVRCWFVDFWRSLRAFVRLYYTLISAPVPSRAWGYRSRTGWTYSARKRST